MAGDGQALSLVGRGGDAEEELTAGEVERREAELVADEKVGAHQAIEDPPLPRLLANPRTRALIEDLRREGWLDWRILGALSTRALNWRVEQTDPRTVDDNKSTMLRLMRDPEPVEGPMVPLSIFIRESLEMVDNFNIASSLRNWDLDLRQRTPDIKAIRLFLNERDRHDKDDIDHDDPFSVESARISCA